MSLDWYPWHIQKYRRATTHLGLAEDGAYRRLIDEYMMTHAPLPDNDAALARIVGVSKEEWLSIASTIRPFFEASHGKLINRTCEEQLHTQRILGEQRSAHAKTAVDARWKKHRENKEVIQREYPENTSRILKHTTLQDNTSLPSLLGAGEKTEQPTGSLASGPLNGPLTRPPEIAAKRPSEVTRAELDAAFAAKRSVPENQLGGFRCVESISRETTKVN